jgi:hypothetical protein
MNRVYNLTRIHSPRLVKKLAQTQKNPSLECLENIMKLPKMNKEYKVDIIDDNFTIRYYENKKRVSLTYKKRNQIEAGVTLW